MRKIFALMLVVTLLTSLFLFNLVEAKGKTVTLTGKIIKVSLEKASKSNDSLALKCENKNYSLTGSTINMRNFINYNA